VDNQLPVKPFFSLILLLNLRAVKHPALSSCLRNATNPIWFHQPLSLSHLRTPLVGTTFRPYAIYVFASPLPYLPYLVPPVGESWNQLLDEIGRLAKVFGETFGTG